MVLAFALISKERFNVNNKKVDNSKIIALDEREWLLKRPTIHLGPTSLNEVEFYFPQFKEFRITSFIPALQKLFDEVLENSVDEFIRTKGKYADIITVDINEDHSITVTDNGRGLPIEKHDHPEYKDKYVPEVIFTVMRSGSNFDDDSRAGIGANGVGVSLVALFSNSLKVKTYQNNQQYTQEFNNMLLDISKPKVKDISSDATGTEITFLPNFEFFKAKNWNVDVIEKRVIDLAYSHPKIKFKFNGKTIKTKKIVDYLCNMEEGECNKDIYEMAEGEHARFIITTNDTGDFKFGAFVNGANTFKGGEHINQPLNEIINYIRPKLEKKYKITLSPKDIKNHIIVFVWVDMKTPWFSSQTKEEIINKATEVKPYFDDILNEGFYKRILKNDIIVNKIVEEALAKKALNDQIDVNRKQKKLSSHKVPKLLDANGKDRENCTLFICEGDSASSKAESVRDRNYHAFLPSKGKILNVLDVPAAKVLANDEIKNIMSSIGIKLGDNETTPLRFGRIVPLADADPDGMHITSLFCNFIFKYWPWMFDKGIICTLKPPLYIAEKGKEKIYIYDKEEHDELLRGGKLKGYNISYFKGLAGLETDDWKYFLNTNPKFVSIKRTNKTGEKIEIAFGESADKRKEWLAE